MATGGNEKTVVRCTPDGFAWLKAEARLQLAKERLSLALASVQVLSDALEVAREGRDYGEIGRTEGAFLWEALSPLLGVSGMLMDVADYLEGLAPGRRGPGIVTTPIWVRAQALEEARDARERERASSRAGRSGVGGSLPPGGGS